MNVSSREVIRAVYETREELTPVLQNLDYRALSKYNYGYLKYQRDPSLYFIDAEINRFLYSAEYINKNFPKTAKILDIGLFVPVLPIVLTKLGFQIEAIEKLSLYEDALDPILEFIETKYKFTVHNIDIINDDISQFKKEYDLVLLMAILEHLNGSPKKLLEICRELLSLSGSLMVEVPNVASLSRRLAFLFKGNPPFPDFQDYFLSDYPFEGHNREYNSRELQYALTNTGFDIYEFESLNIALIPGAKLRTRFIKWASRLGDPSWRDVLWTVSRLKQ